MLPQVVFVLTMLCLYTASAAQTPGQRLRRPRSPVLAGPSAVVEGAVWWNGPAGIVPVAGRPLFTVSHALRDSIAKALCAGPLKALFADLRAASETYFTERHNFDKRMLEERLQQIASGHDNPDRYRQMIEMDSTTQTQRQHLHAAAALRSFNQNTASLLAEHAASTTETGIDGRFQISFRPQEAIDLWVTYATFLAKPDLTELFEDERVFFWVVALPPGTKSPVNLNADNADYKLCDAFLDTSRTP